MSLDLSVREKMLLENGSDWGNGTDTRLPYTKIYIDIGVGLFIALENLFALLVIIRSKYILLQIRMLILSLCFLDILSGMIYSVPGEVFELYFQCRLKKYPLAYVLMTSLLTVSMMNFDRFLAIYFGIKYYIRVTYRKLKVVIFVMWTFCFIITYFLFYSENDRYGIVCSYLKDKPFDALNVIGYCCCVVIVISNFSFYVFIVATMKTKDRWRSVAKISVISGSVLVLSTPGLFVFVLFPTYGNNILYICVGLPLLVKSVLDPFLFVWRFKDARYQCKLAFYFWSKKRRETIHNDRKHFYSSYTIGTINEADRGAELPRHVKTTVRENKNLREIRIVSR